MRSLISDLQKNYPDDPTAKKAIIQLNTDLVTLDAEYNKLSDMVAKGERDDHNEQCTKVAQNEAKIRSAKKHFKKKESEESVKTLAYQHLPFESDFQLSDPQDPPSFLWEDRYLQHPDLRSLPRSQDVFRKIELDPCLLLALPKPSATAGRILEHAIQTFEDLVSKNKPLTFKFGITHDASIRWNNETFGYKYSKDIFDYMLVIYGASNPYGPAFLEAASCVSQILTAEAVAHDMGECRAADVGVRQWAKCHVKNSERDVHRTMKKQKTKLEIPVGTIDCDGCEIPWISPESWLQFVVDRGLWPVLAGCALSDYEGARCNWSEFWQTYEKVNPSFDLFHMQGIDLSRTAACLIHGDEGRTLKRGGMLVTSLQSALGRGYDEKRVRRQALAAGDRPPLYVNFAGHSFTTRFVVSTIPKTAYDVQPELFHSALDHVARSCRKLLDNGCVDKSRGGETFRIVILGVKGDAPYLTKAAHFYRSYNTTAKRGEERGPPKGCCPYCLAGTRLCAAEEVATDKPQWLSTVGVKLPWVRNPALIRHLVHDRSFPAGFFKSDIWHVFHLGFGRSWVASVLQCTLPYLPCDNLEQKFDFLTSKYLAWCAGNKKQAHVSRITPYLMSYGDASGAMGNWHKGALTTNFMQFLVDLLGQIPLDQEGLLLKCRAATYRMNAMFSLLYRAGAFLTENECVFVSEQGLAYLDTYAHLANAMFRAGKQWLFPLYPKLHIFHHIILEVKQQGLAVKTACNPTMWGCQMDEDLVGKASRLSRRVSIRKVASRSLDRPLHMQPLYGVGCWFRKESGCVWVGFWTACLFVGVSCMCMLSLFEQ
ncbi:unnamed protein product [Durusdinium trenchii]|uniref:Uncharacterized protein n=2 Tax=Durusdinium trenchii TaxID=1381693 RepID=A0ABP0KL18_9DINO